MPQKKRESIAVEEMTSPLPPTVGYPDVTRRRMRALRTCGYFLMLSCGFLFVPGSILVGLGAHDTGSGEALIRRPGIVLLSIAITGVAVGILLCCCVRKYREKHMAETILMKRHSVYSVTSMRSHRSSAVSNPSSVPEQRSPTRSRSSRQSRSPSYSRQSSQDSRQSPQRRQSPPRRQSRSPSATYSRKSSVESRTSASRRSSSCSYRGLIAHPGKSSRRSSAASVRSSSRSPRTSIIAIIDESDVRKRLLSPPRRASQHKSLPSIELADFSTADLSQESSRRTSKDSNTFGKHGRSMSLSASFIEQRRGSHGNTNATKEMYLTVPSQHRRFSR